MILPTLKICEHLMHTKNTCFKCFDAVGQLTGRLSWL